MATRLYSRIVMLGAAPETRGAIATVVDAYRTHGLLKRWPVPELAGKPNLALFLGHLEAAKGIYDLLDALAGVRSAVPDVRLACAGDGDRIGVARYAENLGIAEAVKFTGWVGPSGKRALLEHAAVFALPSYEEALPVSLIEAMSAGVPVVATPVGGIPEVVADNTSGFLVAPGDKGALERARRRLLVDR